MQWLSLIQLQQSQQPKQLKTLRKWKSFTLYQHNSYVYINQQQLTFTCIFNSKKLTSQHSILGKIHVSFITNQITISNTLTDCQLLLSGKYQYQKIQLTRFAFRYNQRSHNNILIKVNPINGEVIVCMNFLFKYSMFDNEHDFKTKMTDACTILGEQAEKIFNTMIQIIYQRQANEPYLKSGIKVNPNFPRYMKVQKLLDKVKSLISTSSHYKIKVDTSSAHKNRSYFKKLYLINDKRYIKDQQIQKLALLYQLKYNKVYQDPVRKIRDKMKDFIKDYTEIQQKNQIQFAKHLHQNMVLEEMENYKISISQVQKQEEIQSNSNSKIKRSIVITSNKQKKYVLIDQYNNNTANSQQSHVRSIIQRLKHSHPNICQHYFDPAHKNIRITNGYNSIFLSSYLSNNKVSMSLSTKFQIMSQICHSLQYLHKRGIGCFIRLQDYIIDEGFRIKLRNLQKTYMVEDNNGWKQYTVSGVNNLNSNMMVSNNNNMGKFSNNLNNFQMNEEFSFISCNNNFKLQMEYLYKLVQFPYIDIFSGRSQNTYLGNQHITQINYNNSLNISSHIKSFDDNQNINYMHNIQLLCISNNTKILMNQKCDVYSLGILLYRIMMDKYPFYLQSIKKQLENSTLENYHHVWNKIWTVETEYYLTQGGPITKLVAHLLLKCFNVEEIKQRPYVEWMTVILSQIKTSLNGLY